MQLARWQRTTLGCVIIPLLVVLGAATIFYFAVLDTSFSTTVVHPDTGLSLDAGNPLLVEYEERPGRVTLVVARGAHPDKFMSGHGWREEVAIDLPRPATGDRIEIGNPDVKVALIAHNDHRVRWSIGAGGVRGHVDIESVDTGRLTARYEIEVDASTVQPAYRNRPIIFEGRATFAAVPRPASKRYGDLWPKP